MHIWIYPQNPCQPLAHSAHVDTNLHTNIPTCHVHFHTYSLSPIYSLSHTLLRTHIPSPLPPTHKEIIICWYTSRIVCFISQAHNVVGHSTSFRYKKFVKTFSSTTQSKEIAAIKTVVAAGMLEPEEDPYFDSVCTKLKTPSGFRRLIFFFLNK